MTKSLIRLFALLPFLATAGEYYVDGKTGDDANDGRSPARALRTLAAATAKLRAGDVLHLAPGAKYYESLRLTRSGTAEAPIVVRGHGAVLSALRPFPAEGWQDKGDGLFFYPDDKCWGSDRPRVFLGEERMISVVCAHYDQVDERSLKPLEAIWKLKGAWFRAEPGRRPSDYDLRGPRVSGPVGDSGVLISKADYLTVEDLTCEGFANDGFNVHGSCHGLVFRNVTARWNGDDGFSVHEDVQATVFNLHSHHNDFGIQDIGASQTSFFGCLIETNRLCGIDLYSGMRIVYDTVVRGNGGGQIRLNPGMGKTMGFEPENPMLVLQAYLKRVRVDGGEGAGLAVGKDCRVCAADCRVSGTDVGVRVDGGDLHWVGGTVAGCRRELDVGKARSFVTDGPRGGSRSD